MKTILITGVVLVLALSCPHSSLSQDDFLYDQQSATGVALGGFPFIIQARQPLGQSFTPQFSAVGFVRLKVDDATNGNGIGATLTVNLRADSITGPILGTSEPVALADSYHGYPDFYFGEPVAVTPGVTYYLQPVVQTGDVWAVSGYNSYNYAGGTQYVDGAPLNFYDLWFREGVIVPEPSTLALVVLGTGSLLWLARHRRRRPRATFPRA